VTSSARQRGATILLNATTVNKGGSLQAVISLIHLLYSQYQCNDGARWIFAVSGEVREQLATLGHSLRDDTDLCLTESPARSLRSRRALRDFAHGRADLVFTFFGPAYVTFHCSHVCGVADPWVTHPTLLAYSRLPGIVHKIHWLMLAAYKARWFRRADGWIVEHEAASDGLIARVGLPAESVHVVSNNCAQAYFDAPRRAAARDSRARLRVLIFAANYPHKCLDLVPKVAAALAARPGMRDVEFVLTVPPREYAVSAIAAQARLLAVEDKIVNVGYVPLRDGPALYQGCDIVLMPTVLETFTATFPEAMCMGLPIVTTDLGFARSVCRDAALYFKPMNAADAAAKLAAVIEDPRLWGKLVDAGYRRVRDFPTPAEKYRQIRVVLGEKLASDPRMREPMGVVS
jgi:glycosyltransferase involved in cell wall biosynthesis